MYKMYLLKLIYSLNFTGIYKYNIIFKILKRLKIINIVPNICNLDI